MGTVMGEIFFCHSTFFVRLPLLLSGRFSALTCEEDAYKVYMRANRIDSVKAEEGENDGRFQRSTG